MKNYKAPSILKSALARLKKQNPAISIRGLAVKLKFSHAFLSKVLSGKAAVPESRIKDFVKVFQLDPFAEKELKDAVISGLEATSKIAKILQPKGKVRGRKAIDVYKELPIRRSAIMENWYELPILDYLTCEGVSKTPESIATRFSLEPSQVLSVLKKLSEEGLTEKDSNGDWMKTETFMRYPNSAPSQVLRQYYTDVLKRMTNELNKDSQSDYDRRLIVNFSIATSSLKLSEFKERLSQFLYNISVEMAEGPADEVYHLTLGLVPLTCPVVDTTKNKEYK